MIVSKRTLYFFKICGLATMRFNTNPSEKERVQSSWCSSSKKGQLYNAILICFIIVSNCYIARFVYEDNLSSRQFERTFDIVQYIYTTITTIVILMVFCFYQGRAVSIANKLKSIHLQIINLNRQLSKEKEPALSILKKIGTTSTIIWFLVVFTTSDFCFSVVMYYLSIYPCILIINCIFLQYSIILHLLKQLFLILNANFRYESRRSVVSKKVGATDSSQETQPFSDLCKLYESLCDLSMDVSEFYNLVMLFCLSYVFMTVTMWMYYITVPLVARTMPLSIFQYIHSLMILVQHIIMLIILTISVDAVLYENKKTGEITNRWLANLHNQHLINELNLFSNYLLHNNVSFTVYGLFSLDESLLMSITGSIATYLVILLQFQSSNQKQDVSRI